MAELADRALRDSLEALIKKNLTLAYSVILRDQYIDELEKELDRLCLEFLVRQQPVAGHLRFAYATIKINLELERIGDYAESVARQVLKVSALHDKLPIAHFAELANVSIPMLHNAVKAFVEQDAQLAHQTMSDEDRADGLRNKLDSDLVQLHQNGTIPLNALNPLQTIARRFERLADPTKTGPTACATSWIPNWSSFTRTERSRSTHSIDCRPSHAASNASLIRPRT